jgi:hypothetical protein
VGKTALYLALLEQESNGDVHAHGLTFGDYPWGLHSKYSYELTTRHERFLASWRFLTALEIFKILLTADDRRSRYTKKAQDALNEVESFIQKNWGVIAFDYKKTFPSGGLNLDGLSISPEIAGFGLGGVQLKRTGALGATIERLNEWLSNALAAVASEAPSIFVLFDELDAGYDLNSEDYVDRVVGLLLGVRLMAREFSRFNGRFYPVAFLRSDIYDSLHFGDKNKVTEANVVSLSWNDDLDYHGSSLKQLIDHRIRKSLGLSSNIQSAWNRAFDGDVMRGTQHKFNHITFRTYLRPRDVIKFTNCALDSYKQRVQREGEESKISNDDVTNARLAYSKYLLNELDDEIAGNYLEWNDYLEVLRRIKETKFTRPVFEEAHRLVDKQFNFKNTLDELLRFFYRYSIIGFERSPGGEGLEYHFRYLDESVRFQPDAKAFMVHRGLKEVLELKDTGQPVESLR